MSSNKTQYVVTAYIKDKKGRVLAIGKNSYVKTHPEMVKLGKKVGYLNNEKPFIHAEIDAINRCVNLDKAHLIEVYVCTDRSKVYRNSTPCSICAMAILKTGIKFVKFLTQEGEWVVKPVKELISNRGNHACNV